MRPPSRSARAATTRISDVRNRVPRKPAVSAPRAAGSQIPDAEAALIAGLRAGEADSRERLVRLYGGRMLAVIRRIVQSEDDAQDCLQEAFLQAFDKVEGFEGRAALGTWLHRIAVNAALMHLRGRQRRREDPIEDLLPQFDGDGRRVTGPGPELPPVEALHEQQENVALVRRAVARLPESYRIVLLLRDIEEYTTDETATELDLTPGAVKVRLHRARSALKTLIERLLEENRAP